MQFTWRSKPTNPVHALCRARLYVARDTGLGGSNGGGEDLARILDEAEDAIAAGALDERGEPRVQVLAADSAVATINALREEGRLVACTAIIS